MGQGFAAGGSGGGAPKGEAKVDVKLTYFNYEPGDKWTCGALDFDADTSLGRLSWREVVPGPRHGDDSAELTVTLNGNEVSCYKPGTQTCYNDFDLPNFDPPRKDGRAADRFAAEGEAEVEKVLRNWLEENREHSELQRVLALPPLEEEDEDEEFDEDQPAADDHFEED